MPSGPVVQICCERFHLTDEILNESHIGCFHLAGSIPSHKKPADLSIVVSRHEEVRFHEFEVPDFRFQRSCLQPVILEHNRVSSHTVSPTSQRESLKPSSDFRPNNAFNKFEELVSGVLIVIVRRMLWFRTSLRNIIVDWMDIDTANNKAKSLLLIPVWICPA